MTFCKGMAREGMRAEGLTRDRLRLIAQKKDRIEVQSGLLYFQENVPLINYFSATTSKGRSTITSLCNLTEALYLPNLFTIPPATVMNFLSIS